MANPIDSVNHPLHYQGTFEAIDVIEDVLNCGQWQGPQAFLLGNTLKYLYRAGRKGDRLEDLKKAEWYLTRLIQHIEYHD